MDGAERSARWDSYKTTAMRAYTPKKGPAAEIIRPYDTKHFGHSYKLGEPVGSNAYQDDYGWKPYSRAELIRTATSSGSRNHNPHPSQNFMRWKMPREQAEADPNSRSPWRIPASTRDFQRTISAQYTSTLREDFLDRTKAMALKQTLRAPPEWKTLIPRWPETEFRRNYGIPPKIPELQDFSWKYGCYSNLPSAVKGIVPTVILRHIWNQKHTKLRSTYQRDYGKDELDIVMILNSLDARQISKFLQKVPNEERKILQGFLRTYYGNAREEKIKRMTSSVSRKS
ncbi:testis-expressed protein 26 isoform X1 [Ornithorhynchus anatinus]|uniref:Testis expressed 26 n=1 Tax=Ornithorhynchus anatinus TaxID=9258 RepID=A0A6I8PPW8_ORNAN|nr:testis-expressed protein 26 isoform X1 [Ornithorhynchus anatinus]